MERREQARARRQARSRMRMEGRPGPGRGLGFAAGEAAYIPSPLPSIQRLRRPLRHPTAGSRAAAVPPVGTGRARAGTTGRLLGPGTGTAPDRDRHGHGWAGPDRFWAVLFQHRARAGPFKSAHLEIFTSHRPCLV